MSQLEDVIDPPDIAVMKRDYRAFVLVGLDGYHYACENKAYTKGLYKSFLCCIVLTGVDL